MKTRSILLAGTVFIFLVTTASADNPLQADEVLQIFKQLTSQPRTTWIPAGTIQATHQEYGAPKTLDSTAISNEIQKALSEYEAAADKIELTEELQKMTLEAIPFNVRYELANEYTMTSRVTVRYDGERFYWEINVDSRRDSVRPDASLAGNFMTDQFDLNWNGRRIFAWDGQNYTRYAASANRASVDAAGKLPRAVNGPLTAGLIPWGHGRYAYADLAAAQTSAKEVNLDGKTQIEMTITYAGGEETGVTLDPSKAYAVTAATFDAGGSEVVSYTCSGYRLVEGNWVPSSVSIERRDRTTDKLLQSEDWTLTSVSASVPAANSFNVPLALDAVVEYASPLSAASSLYTYSATADTDELLAQRLSYQAAQGRRPQNCSTAALQYVASRLGRPVSGGALAPLVGTDGQTNLLAMKQLAQGMGLYCRAVTTDLTTLKDLPGVMAILHIPGRNHFVVLDQADEQYVWLVDLSNSNFYYRRNMDLFPLEWSEGTALLLSDRPISGRFNEIPDGVSTAIAGSTGWTCTHLLQVESVTLCRMLSGACDGAVTHFFRRYGCESAPSGTCINQVMLRFEQMPCIWDPDYICGVTGQWYYGYMVACE